jgi:hypothetical protein
MTWEASAHDGIVSLDEGLWMVQAKLPHQALVRTCVVARMEDGGLLIHSAIAMDEDSMAALESFGVPAFLVVPSGFHRMDAARYKARYPDLTVLCPAGARKKVAKVVAVDGDYEALPQDARVSLIPGEGLGRSEGVLRVQGPSGVTLVFNDLLFNMAHVEGPSGWFVRLIGSSGGPRVTPVAKMFVVRDKRAAADWIRSLADTPDLSRVVPGHGTPITQDPAGVLRKVAEKLSKPLGDSSSA